MHRRAFLKSGGTAIGCVLATGGITACVGRPGVVDAPGMTGFDGHTMGTRYSVRVAGELPWGLDDAVRRGLAEIEARYSTWQPSSELSRFNDSDDTDWQPASTAMLRLVRLAERHHQTTDGAFDATIGPLVDLWGFGARVVASGGSPLRPPAPDRVERVRAHVGASRIDLDTGGGRWRKHDPAMRLDFSGIAKGEAVDQIAILLDEQGVAHWLVEIGGEVRTRGRKPDGSPWRVGIEQPDVARRRAFRVVEPDGRALATSGDYRHYFEHAGRRFSHAIDPRSGRPTAHTLASISVAAETAVAADALSTGLMVLGPERAMALAETNGIAVHLLLRTHNRLRERWSSRFEPLIAS